MELNGQPHTLAAFLLQKAPLTRIDLATCGKEKYLFLDGNQNTIHQLSSPQPSYYTN
jgi:hypothetical protein